MGAGEKRRATVTVSGAGTEGETETETETEAEAEAVTMSGTVAASVSVTMSVSLSASVPAHQPITGHQSRPHPHSIAPSLRLFGAELAGRSIGGTVRQAVCARLPRAKTARIE